MPKTRYPMSNLDMTSSHDEIIAGAAQLFMEYGYAATTINAIADYLGCTKGRIYYHFDSKADLFLQVQVYAMERLIQEIEPIAHSSLETVEKLSKMAFHHIWIVLTELPMQKVAVQGLDKSLLGAVTLKHKQTLRNISDMRDYYEETFAEVINEGRRKNIFVDLPGRFATKPFFGVLNWATVWFTSRILQSEEEIAEIAQKLADYALRGLLKG